VELPEAPDDHAERLGERVIARVDNAALLGQIASLEKRAERAEREALQVKHDAKRKKAEAEVRLRPARDPPPAAAGCSERRDGVSGSSAAAAAENIVTIFIRVIPYYRC
jgi:hypothetical protein